jgi:hypothetical protein
MIGWIVRPVPSAGRVGMGGRCGRARKEGWPGRFRVREPSQRGDVVRTGRCTEASSVDLVRLAPHAPSHDVVPHEHQLDRRRRRKMQPRRPVAKPSDDLPRSPGRMLLANGEHSSLDLERSAPSLRLPGARHVEQAARAVFLEPGAHLVSRLPADPELAAQVADPFAAKPSLHEFQTFRHRVAHFPGHVHLPHVPSVCHPCARSTLLPMCPVRTSAPGLRRRVDGPVLPRTRGGERRAGP